MIYQTIPAKYLDHTQLLQTINEGMTLLIGCKIQADIIAEKLIDEELSGNAYNMGKSINSLKNYEVIIKQNCKTLCEFVDDLKLVAVATEFQKSFDGIAYLDKLPKNENFHKALEKAHSVWQEKAIRLVIKYDTCNKYRLSSADLDLTEHAIAENLIE